MLGVPSKLMFTIPDDQRHLGTQEAKPTWTLVQLAKEREMCRGKGKHKGKSYGTGDERFRHPKDKGQHKGQGKRKGSRTVQQIENLPTTRKSGSVLLVANMLVRAR